MSESHAIEIIAVIVACAAYLIAVSAGFRTLGARLANGIALALFLAGAAYRHYVKRERY